MGKRGVETRYDYDPSQDTGDSEEPQSTRFRYEHHTAYIYNQPTPSTSVLTVPRSPTKQRTSQATTSTTQDDIFFDDGEHINMEEDEECTSGGSTRVNRNVRFLVSVRTQD